MNKYEIRRLKRNIYKYGNVISYGVIFLIATIITIVAAAGRTDNVAYVDESQLITSNAVDIKGGESQKVAVNETELLTEDVTEEDTEVEATPEVTESTEATSVGQVKITADSLNVRKAAASDAEPMGEVVMDEVYNVLGYEGQWVKIQFGNEEGYINAAYVQVVQ